MQQVVLIVLAFVQCAVSGSATVSDEDVMASQLANFLASESLELTEVTEAQARVFCETRDITGVSVQPVQDCVLEVMRTVATATSPQLREYYSNVRERRSVCGSQAVNARALSRAAQRLLRGGGSQSIVGRFVDDDDCLDSWVLEVEDQNGDVKVVEVRNLQAKYA